jgi:hypothetical protein
MEESKTGKFQCSQAFGQCLYPVPELTLEQKLVLELLRICRHQFNRVGTFSSERRIGIPFSAVKDAAQFFGVRLNPKRLKLFLSCVDALVSDDIVAIREANPK